MAVLKELQLYFRDLLIQIKAFKLTISLFLLLTVFGSLLLHLKFGISYLHAYYEVIALMFFASSFDYPAGDTFFEFIWILFPMLTLFILAGSLGELGTAIKLGDKTSPEWNKEVVKLMDAHIIIVGLGNLGQRVVEELVKIEQDFVVIDKQEADEAKDDYIEYLQTRKKIPVIIGDATQASVLQNAGIANAKTLMLLIDDDLLNLKIAMKARALHPYIQIIMRMFDIEFGEEIAEKLQLSLLSTTKIAVKEFVRIIEHLDEQ